MSERIDWGGAEVVGREKRGDAAFVRDRLIIGAFGDGGLSNEGLVVC